MEGLQCFRYPWRHSGDLEFKKSLNLTRPKPPQAPPLPHFFFLVCQSEVEVTALLADFVRVCERERDGGRVCVVTPSVRAWELYISKTGRGHPEKLQRGRFFVSEGGDMEWFTKKRSE